MKILIVSQYFYPEPFRVNLIATELVKRGHEVTVLTGYPQYPQGEIYDGYGFDKPYEEVWNGVRIERVKMLPRGKNAVGMLMNCYTYVREAKKWVRRCKEKYDAVYVFEVSPVTVGLPAVYYKKKFGTPVFFNALDLWPENVETVLGIKNKLVLGAIRRLVKKLYTDSDYILCPSQSFVENTFERGIPREKIVYWPQFCAAPQLEDMVRPTALSEGCFNIVFTGNLGEAQGLDLLVETAERLKDTNVRWILVGDGRARERLETAVVDRDLIDVVTFVGRVSEEEANRYIHFADCAYLSFQKNKVLEMTLPAKLQSYMACGTPIIVAAEGESARVVLDAKCGFVSSQDAQQLERMIREDVLPCTTLAEMRMCAKRYFDNHFEMNALMDRLCAMMK